MIKSCEKGSLRQGNILRRLSEIGAGRGPDPVIASAEIDPVEIKLQNFLLCEPVLQPERQKKLVRLARPCPLRLQKQVLGKLLRDRRAALFHRVRPQISNCRPD